VARRFFGRITCRSLLQLEKRHKRRDDVVDLSDYKIDILIGMRPNGMMTVIAELPYVPREAEVQERGVGIRCDLRPAEAC
jgi:hypothetical protein